METSRINVVYRPMRLAWAIHSADRAALRRVARTTHAFWGGRFNPIVFADKPDEAKALIEVFRADHIVPVGDSPEMKGIRDRFPHLITPFFSDELFLDRQHARPLSHVLDIHNLLVHWNEKPEWRVIKDQGIRCVSWDDDDPLADALLLQYGAYPPTAETGIDYNDILFQATMAIELRQEKAEPIKVETLNHPNIGYIARYGLRRHYSVRAGGWNTPGFFFGDGTDIEDLVAFWNLRAADISLHFIDLNHSDRYQAILPVLKDNFPTAPRQPSRASPACGDLDALGRQDRPRTGTAGRRTLVDLQDRRGTLEWTECAPANDDAGRYILDGRHRAERRQAVSIVHPERQALQRRQLLLLATSGGFDPDLRR
jgi:hypothetical protein